MLTVSLAPEPASPHPGCLVLLEAASGGHLDTGVLAEKEAAREGAGKPASDQLSHACRHRV